MVTASLISGLIGEVLGIAGNIVRGGRQVFLEEADVFWEFN